jgi:TPR repeat protein
LKALNNSKAALAQIKVVEWLKNNVANGAASDQRALAEHYLKGEGCETNRELAIFWLQKASDQGDIDASNKLVMLKN